MKVSVLVRDHHKFLTENDLRETPRHTAYSLRHSFEDRMLENGIDDRIRAELMGHKYARQLMVLVVRWKPNGIC